MKPIELKVTGAQRTGGTISGKNYFENYTLRLTVPGGGTDITVNVDKATFEQAWYKQPSKSFYIVDSLPKEEKPFDLEVKVTKDADGVPVVTFNKEKLMSMSLGDCLKAVSRAPEVVEEDESVYLRIDLKKAQEQITKLSRQLAESESQGKYQASEIKRLAEKADRYGEENGRLMRSLRTAQSAKLEMNRIALDLRAKLDSLPKDE